MDRSREVASSPRRTTASAGPAPAELVTTPDALDRVVEALTAASRYAVDTEFHRERTYWPRLALIQLAWQAEPGSAPKVALIDPLAVDPLPLAKVLEGSGAMVAHAAAQDLQVLQRACQTVPSVLFDTQIAAGFLGCGPASLGALAERFLSLRLGKGDRLTDWSRRPLTSSQLAYAADDARHLLPLADAISAELTKRGRLNWAEEECAALLARPLSPPSPEEAWWKLRDHRQFQGASRGVAQEVAAWREQKARALDVPPRTVLPDLALLSIAQSPPGDLTALRETRGLDPRHLRDGLADELMAAIARGKSLPPERARLAPTEHVSKELRPAVSLATAWVAQLSRDEEVDAALLATRTDIVEFLSGKAGARLGQGWRARLVGAPLRRIANGQAALYLDGGRLRLQERLPEGMG